MIRLLRYEYANAKNRRRTKQIYESSFPKCERFNFDILIKCNKESNVHLNCILCDDVVIGMSFTILLPNDILYLMYFAIDAEHRNKCIGSSVIRDYVITSDKLMLFIEEPIDASTQRRKDFYIKNGLYDTGIVIEDSGVTYAVLISVREYIPSEADLLNRYRYMTNSKLLWKKISRTFNTENVVLH